MGAVAAGALALAGPVLGADAVSAALPGQLVAGTQFTLTLSSTTDDTRALQYTVLGRLDDGRPCDPTSQDFRATSAPATSVTLIDGLARTGPGPMSATASAPKFAGSLRVCAYLERAAVAAPATLAVDPQVVPVRLPEVTGRAVISPATPLFQKAFDIVVAGMAETQGRAVERLQAAPCASSPPAGARSSTVLAGSFSVALRAVAQSTARPVPDRACVWVTASGFARPPVVFRATLPLTLRYDATLVLRGGRIVRPRRGQLRGRSIVELTGTVTGGTVRSASPKIRSGPRCGDALPTLRRGRSLTARCVLAGRPGPGFRAAIAYHTRLGASRETAAGRYAAP